MSVATRVEPARAAVTASEDSHPESGPRRRNPVRELRRRSANTMWGVVSIVVFVCSVFPVYWMLNTSFKPNADVISPTPQWWPENFTLRNYITVLFEPSRPDRANFMSSFGTSLAVTGLTLLICLLFAFIGAIAVSRFKFRGRRQYIITLLIIQMIPGEALMFTIFGMVDSWRLLNTIIGLTIVYLAGVLPFTIWMLRGFVAGVPADLEEAAMIDGCTRTQAFWKVTFPLLAPGLISTGVFAFIQAWNEFLMALIIMQSPGSYTLPIWLRAFQQATQATNWAAIMAGSTLLALPVVIFFLFVQGRMTGGLVSGAVKG